MTHDDMICAYRIALLDESVARASFGRAQRSRSYAEVQSQREEADAAIRIATVALDKAQAWVAECERRMDAAGIKDDIAA